MLREEFGSDMTQTALEIHLKWYHMLDFDRNKIRAHNTRSGHNTTIYTIEFLNSDWLYFLWYDMKKYILFIII